MKVAAAYVRERVEAEGLDRLIATAKGYGAAGGGIIGKANGTDEVLDMLDTLPAQVQGDFAVKVWKDGPNKGRKALAELCYTFIIEGTMNANNVNGYGGTGPGWRELMDLKMEILKRDMEDKYAKGKDDTLEKMMPMIQGIAARLLGGPSAAPAPVAAPVASPGPQRKEPTPEDDELKDILANVVRFYRRNPQQAREFAPMLKDMADGSSATA